MALLIIHSGCFHAPVILGALVGKRVKKLAVAVQDIRRPKYESNSDIEILDEDVRNRESTVDTAERFSSRLSHTPSKAALPRYLVDPWILQVNGSRSRKDGPLDRNRTKSLSGSVNYDLRIPGNYRLGRYPLIKHIPLACKRPVLSFENIGLLGFVPDVVTAAVSGRQLSERRLHEQGGPGAAPEDVAVGGVEE